MTDEESAVALSADEQPGRANRWPLIAGAAVGVVLLATIGAMGGWVLAGGDGSRQQADGPSGPPVVSTSPTTAGPVERSSDPGVPSTRPPRPAAGQFPLPNLVGKDFREARDELHKRKLGWQFVFGAAGDDPTVASTNPAADTLVKAGMTVRVVVVGAAPPVTIPAVVGLPCKEAAKRAVDNGLTPRYPKEDNGKVMRQEPEPSGQARWNDELVLYCGRPPDDPSGSPTP
jgi:hypothetical protein